MQVETYALPMVQSYLIGKKYKKLNGSQTLSYTLTS